MCSEAHSEDAEMETFITDLFHDKRPLKCEVSLLVQKSSHFQIKFFTGIKFDERSLHACGECECWPYDGSEPNGAAEE